MVTLTKKQLWKENDEWVVVGSKREKPELGWVVVPSDKSKPAPTDEPDRVDKILARHGVCKRSEAKAFLRNGRVTFEGETVTRVDQRVEVRLFDGVHVDGKPVPVSHVPDKENETDGRGK